ncbi:hypothetical protein RvY_00842 [Ramazzottius varieornatus]|uniref:Uncharacterized protein n=1 Tax=Ramazzottius varieornatus TaxID=947166 RepID=A0A1D1UF34_RAMVA|nr:hypothetical protein RvY_00842 [Ramazzottius varieornatus]
MDQPMEAVLKDVQNKVQKVLHAFMPQQFPQRGCEFLTEQIGELVHMDVETSREPAVETLKEAVVQRDVKEEPKPEVEAAVASTDVSIKSESSDGETGWDLVAKQELEEEEKSAVLRVEEALQAMADMGYKDEHDLLRTLLENYDGDISSLANPERYGLDNQVRWEES